MPISGIHSIYTRTHTVFQVCDATIHCPYLILTLYIHKYIHKALVFTLYIQCPHLVFTLYIHVPIKYFKFVTRLYNAHIVYSLYIYTRSYYWLHICNTHISYWFYIYTRPSNSLYIYIAHIWYVLYVNTYPSSLSSAWHDYTMPISHGDSIYTQGPRIDCIYTMPIFRIHSIYTRVHRLVQVRDTTLTHMWNDSYTNVTWLSHICDITHACAWHVSHTYRHL